jgi:hypothetical protein
VGRQHRLVDGPAWLLPRKHGSPFQNLFDHQPIFAERYPVSDGRPRPRRMAKKPTDAGIHFA